MKKVDVLFMQSEMSEWVLFQLPTDVPLTALDGKTLVLNSKGLQDLGGCKVMVSANPSDHVLPLRAKKGKLKVAGSLTRSVQVLKQ